tara:strand:+ start:9022 stop:10275 length:1254 start_codon:yes stop_codon:yes gene_type:complete
MYNLLTLLLIFNLSKIKEILPKNKIKYKVLVLTKSVGIDDLISSQKKYNKNILYLTFPRYFLKIIFETIIQNHQELTDEKYVSNNKYTNKSIKEYNNFLISFFKIFIKKYPFDLFIGFNFLYVAERELHDVSEKLKIPFLLLFKECVVTKTQFNYQNYTWKKNKEKFKGSKIAVYSKFAKQYLSRAKIANKNNIDIVGCSRLATSFSYKKILPKNMIVYYAIEKYRGLPNRYCKTQSKNFFKNLKDYKSYDKKFNWESSHIKILKILKTFAINNPDIEIIIKTKTGEKYNQNDFKNLPHNIKVIHEGAGHALLKETKVVIGWNSTIILEAIAANRFILLPYFHKVNKLLKKNELDLKLNTRNYGYSEKDFYKKLQNFIEKKYCFNKTNNSHKSLEYYLGNSKNNSEAKLNKFITKNI